MATSQLSDRNGGEPEPGWRGDVAALTAGPQQRWQGAANPTERAVAARRPPKPRRVRLLLLALALLVVGYLYVLLYSPYRTPVLVAVGTNYSWPLAPNAWSKEDLQAVHDALDGETLALRDLSAASSARATSLKAWSESLRELGRKRHTHGSIIIYLSLHGAVGDDEEPCFIPPDASPLDPRGWIPVKDLLQAIKAGVPDEIGKLLVLDCNRELHNWRRGVVQNTFAPHLQRVVEREAVPNLVVLNSTSAGQRAHAGAELNGSALGRAVLLALAGAADGQPLRGQASGGNGDGRVSAQEFRRFVSAYVADWAAANRAEEQTPLWIGANPNADFSLAWTLSSRRQASIRQRLETRRRSAPPVNIDDVAALWRDVETLGGGAKASDESPLFPTPPVLTNPRAWRDLEHQLLHLEQLVAAGAAYDSVAKDEYRSLRRQVNEMQRRKKEESGDTLAARWRVWDEAGAPWPVKEPLPGLAVSEQLGLARDSSPQWRQRLAAWAAEGRPANDAAKPTPSDLDFQRLSERQLLHLLTAYGVGAEWKSPDLVRASWERFDFFEQLAARHDPRAHRALRPHLDQGDALRRQALDRLLAGRGAGAEEPWAEFDAWREQQFNGETSVARRIARAWSVRDTACARLPHIAQWLAGPWWSDSADQDPSSASLNDPIIFEVVPLAQTLKRLCEQLEQVDDRADAQAEPVYLRTADEVQQALTRLESRWVAQYRSLVAQEGAFGTVASQRAKQLLDTPLPDATQRAELLKRLAASVTPPPASPNSPAPPTTTKATAKDGDGDRKSETRPYVQSTSEQLQRELTWHPHPLVALLQIDSSIASAAQPNTTSSAESGAPRGGNARANSGRRADAGRESDSRGALGRHIATDEKSDSKSNASKDAVGLDGNAGVDGGSGSSDREDGDGDGAPSPAGVVASEKDKPIDSSTLSEAERWRYFERLGQRVREHFIAIAAGAAVDGVDAEVAAEPDSPRGLAARERQFRVAAPLMTLVPGRDPVQRNQRHQLQDWLVWHARRTLDDLLGVGPMSPTSVVSREPFFLRATDRYLTWSIASLAESTGRTPPEVAQLRQLLELRKRAVGAGVVIESRASTPDVDDGQFGQTLSVSLRTSDARGEITFGAPTSSGRRGDGASRTPLNLDSVNTTDASSDGDRLVSTLVGEAPPAWPPGTMSAWLRSDRREPLGPRRGFDAPQPGAASNVLVSATKPGSTPAGAQSVVMFRGNEFSAPAVRGAGGLLVRHLPANVDTAKVTVFGDRPQQASVMFILDCSASMSEQIRVEAATKDLIPRMDFAKAALKELLGELAQGGRTRVGVRFFGHRVGWTKTSPVKILKQPGYVGELPDNVTPSGDVELILPLGRFDLAEAGRVEQAMANVRGWGQSPLYYALQETLTDFAVDVKESDKSVVVITDGENYQFSPTESAARAAPKTTLEEIVASYRGTGIRVYILGFGIDSRTSPRAEPEFRRIARETGGEYFNVDNARDLLKRLRSRLGLGLYFVDSDLSSTPGLAAPAGPSVEARDGNGVPLNLPYEIGGLSSGVKRLAVRSEAARELVVVEGGESLELQMSSNGQELLTRPFDKHTLAADVTTASGRGRGMTLRVHHWPRQEISSSSGIVAAPSQQLPLAISIQDEQRKFTRRPAEMWVELTPLVEGDKGVSVDGPRAPLVLYDTFFAPGTPVPVVAWPLVAWPPEDWPAEARRARVDAWFKFERTAPGHVVTLAQVLREPKRFAVGQSVPELPGVVYQIRLGARTGVAARQTIEVVEQMSEGATLAFPAARVQIETEPALRPQLTERRFDASLRTAVHTFVFSKEAFEQLVERPSNARLAFTTREATRQGAYRLRDDRPLMVELSGQSDHLPIDAATGPRR